MDATYKMNKYVIPLVFVCVHTNVDYKVVAEFLCQNEDNEVIFTLSNNASRSNFAAAEFAEHDMKCVNLEKGEFLVKAVQTVQSCLQSSFWSQ